MNPIISRRGVCDPHIHVFNGRAYLYAGKDASPSASTWEMPYWQVYGSGDLVHWRRESVIRPEDTFMGKSDKCFACDAAEKDGKYYFYFSNHDREIGVLASDRPGGGFKDVLRRPLVAEGEADTLAYDPTVFRDDDGRHYLVFGCMFRGAYHIAALEKDMLSLAEAPRPLRVNGSPIADDKSFLHKKGGLYYLSFGSAYAVSESVYGPYEFRGTLGASADHGCFFSWRGQDYHAFTVNDPTCFYRSAGLTYVDYAANGAMRCSGLINEYGVGSYDAAWNRIEFEWYSACENARKAENYWLGTDVVFDGGGSLRFPQVRGLRGKRSLAVFGVSEKGARLRVTDGRGRIRCEMELPAAGGREHYRYRSYVAPFAGGGRGCEELRFDFSGSGAFDFFRFW